ncbi:MAG: acyl carrier protein [Candidatus Omnitrophota bacterium]|jgi:acyl carrier protein
MIDEEIKDLVAAIIEKNPQDIDPNANFYKDLGVDSMMALEILAAIEKKYKISIPEEKLASLITLNDTIAVAKEYIK